MTNPELAAKLNSLADTAESPELAADYRAAAVRILALDAAKPAKIATLWLGVCEINDASGNMLVALSDTQEKAEKSIFREWKRHVYDGFANENKIVNFATLHDWNGASVCEVPINSKYALVWQQCQ